MSADPKCYKCAESEAMLNAVGRQLYVCDTCGAWCCSEHSENGSGTTVYCQDCARSRREPQ